MKRTERGNSTHDSLCTTFYFIAEILEQNVYIRTVISLINNVARKHKSTVNCLTKQLQCSVQISGI